MNIKVIDEFNPEDVAMMQALYSRSSESVDVHIEKVKKSGSSRFLDRYYINYGHQSIADCGSTTVFIEDVSILAAKAIQDWPLYRGQETSTRYIDMSKQRIEDPVNTSESKAIHDKWMKFYFSAQEPLAAHLKQIYPIKPNEGQNIYDKAIKARVFDILRAFLPGGTCTQLSWHTDLRQAADKEGLLKYHVLPEVRNIAINVKKKLVEKYQASFGHKEYAETEAYKKKIVEQFTYFEESSEKLINSGGIIFTTSIKQDEFNQYYDVISTRPVKTMLPLFLSDLGQCSFEFFLDFGSFRDLQRHRNGVCRMPLLTTNIGFHPWYLKEMPEDLRKEAQKLIKEQTKAIESLECAKEIKQYYVALGYMVTCKVTYGLPASVYVVELRSGKTVHPTLRRVAQSMGAHLQARFPALKLHIDYDLDEWDVRRGGQDITYLGA